MARRAASVGSGHEADVIRQIIGPLPVGLYFDRSPIFMPPGALQDCLNIRIRDGKLTNDQMGWTRFEDFQLDGEVTLCDSFRHQIGTDTIFGTRTKLYRLSGATVATLNPLYSTGVASVAGGTSVSGSGTFWNTPGHASHASWARAVAPGDLFIWGTANDDDPFDTSNGGWSVVATVLSDTGLTISPSVGAHASGVYTILKTFSGLADEIWQWAVFPRKDADGLDYLYLTNGAQFVRWEPSLNATQVLLAQGFIPRALSVHQRILVAADVTDIATGSRIPGKIRTSAIGDPDNWTTLEAVEAFATDGQERIAVMKPIGDYLSLYCDQSVRIAAFIGPPVFWAFRTALPGVGIIGRNALMDFGDHHEFMSADTLYSFDGVQNLSIVPHVFRSVMRTIDVERLHQAMAAIDEERGEVIWIVPDIADGDGPSYAWIEHYLELMSPETLPPITKRELPATAIGYHILAQTARFSDYTVEGFDTFPTTAFNDRSFGGLYPVLLFGDWNGFIYILNDGQRDSSGDPLQSWAEFATRPVIGDGAFAGLVQRIEPAVEGVSGNLVVELYGQERLGAPKQLLTAVSYLLDGSGRRFVSARRETRYGTVRFYNSDGRAWLLSAFATDSILGGSR